MYYNLWNEAPKANLKMSFDYYESLRSVEPSFSKKSEKSDFGKNAFLSIYSNLRIINKIRVLANHYAQQFQCFDELSSCCTFSFARVLWMTN